MGTDLLIQLLIRALDKVSNKDYGFKSRYYNRQISPLIYTKGTLKILQLTVNMRMSYTFSLIKVKVRPYEELKRG